VTPLQLTVAVPLALAFLFACIGGYDLVRGLVRARRERREREAAEQHAAAVRALTRRGGA
jgi:uncharacterized membrane protein SpoIIM required for sporulation